MIDKAKLAEVVDGAIAGTDIFVVDIRIEADNRIVVELDSPEALDIDTCARVTRLIEAAFDRDVEDYELEVGSAGLTAPFKVKAQYDKNIGNDIEVLTRDGRKMEGRLVATSDSAFTIEVPVKVKPEGAKRPVMQLQSLELAYDDVKTARYALKFK